jgi:hypothetical protein
MLMRSLPDMRSLQLDRRALRNATFFPVWRCTYINDDEKPIMRRDNVDDATMRRG